MAVGADAPALRAAHLRAAIHALQTTDFALGPCTDGGFYLLAASKCEPELLCFAAMEFSRDSGGAEEKNGRAQIVSDGASAPVRCR